MDFRKAIFMLVLFSFLLIVPSTMGAIKTLHVQENDLVRLSPETLDPDQDRIHYTYFPPLDKNGVWQTGYDDAGEYRLKIVASDGVHQTTKEVLLIVENKNRPPYLTEKKVSVEELQVLDLKQFAVDPDSDPLEYFFTAPFDKDGYWMPSYDDQGTFVTKFTIKDGEFTVPVRLEVEVLNTNQPPKIISSFSDQEKVSVREGEDLSFHVEAEDKDGDAVSFSWAMDGLPLSVRSNGAYYFNHDSAGKHELAVKVQSGQHYVERKWVVDVEEVNRKPEVAISPLTVQEGDLISLDLPRKDADGDTLSYTFKEKFDSKGFWQTTFQDAGTYSLRYEVSDGKEEVKGKVEVTVLDVDRAPELVLPGQLEVKEGEKLSFIVEVSDPDGDDVKITFTNAPEGSLYDPYTNTFTWSPGYDYIKRREGMLSNILNVLRLEQRLLREKNVKVEIQACSNDLCSTGYIMVTVYNVNQPPILEIGPEMILTEGEVLQLRPTAYDADGDIVRYYFTEPAHKRKGSWETSFDDAGEYTIQVTATDGTHSKSLPVVVKVLQKNRQPTVTVPKGQYILSEGKEFVLSIDPFDPDHDQLSLQVENLPEGASFKNNTFAWTPRYDFSSAESSVDLSSVNGASFLGKGGQKEHWITIIASDGEFDVHHPVKLLVRNVNQQPVIQSVVPTEDITLKVGQPFLFSIDAFDADGDSLAYTWIFEPGGEKAAGAHNVERTFVNPGEKKVTVVVSDGNYEILKEWVVKVEEETPARPEEVALEEPKFRVYVVEH